MDNENITDWQALLDVITKEAPAHLLKEIKCTEDLRSKVELCYNTPHIHKALSKWLSSCLKRPPGFKNSEKSIDYRRLGNKFCEEEKYVQALECYNKSLIYSPKNSDEERSAYGNRSHVLLLMHRLEDSIKDIDRALINDASVLRQIKLSARKGECLLALRKYSEARKILNEAASTIQGLNEENKKKSLKTLQQIKKLLEIVNNEVKIAKYENSEDKDSTPEVSHLMNRKLPNLNFTENPDFRFASKQISLRKNEQKGRHVVANEDIQVGDVLFFEKPFAFVILPEMVHKYCSFCCNRISTPVPCSMCACACFCNEKCRDDAMKSFHSWECGGLEVCFSVGIAHLSLRVGLLGLVKENSEKYLEVKNLLSHIDEFQPSDLLSYALTATLFTMYLENYSTLFKDEVRKDKLFDFGGTLLLHTGQLVCNGHAILDMESKDLDPEKSLVVEEEKVRVATAIYPSASMMNHSCDPNIINSFYNSLLIVRATKDLKKGDEVFNCYGPMVYNTEYGKRQELLLSQYFFVCDCIACKNKEGPVTDALTCKHCLSKLQVGCNSCDNCSSVVDVESLIKDLNESDCYYKKGLDEFEKGKHERECEYFQKALSLREKHCHENHRKLLECRDCLARAYISLGKFERAYDLILRNIRAITSIYGMYSIELGQEIMKLLSVTPFFFEKNMERKILEECLELGKRGLMIFSLAYGEWHPRFGEMRSLFDCIKFSLLL